MLNKFMLLIVCFCSSMLVADYSFSQAVYVGEFDPSDELVLYRNQHPAVLRAQTKLGVAGNNIGIAHTELEVSFNGSHFSNIGILNPATPVPPIFGRDRFWLNEVPSVVTTSGGAVHVLSHRYLSDKGDHLYQLGWIALKSASIFRGVESFGSEVKLIAGTAYDPTNPIYPEPRHPIFNLPAEMQECALLTEPATFTQSQGFYLAVDCFGIDGVFRGIHLLDVQFKRGRAPYIRYIANMINDWDVAVFRHFYQAVNPDLKDMVRLVAPDIFQHQGEHYMLVSPAKDGGFGYLGCALLKFKDIRVGELEKNAWGAVNVHKLIVGDLGEHRGACTYESFSNQGIVLSQMYENAFPNIFNIFDTGIEIK